MAFGPAILMSPLPPGFIVSSMFSIGNDSSFLTTITSGFYVLYKDKLTPFRFAGFNPLQNQRILTAIPVTHDWIAIGTNINGCYVINKKGEVIQNLSRKEGLQLNNILTLFLDKDNNLWLGLDDGIDFIAYNNAIKHIYPEKLNEGKGYTSLVYHDDLYVGTSNGFYKVAIGGKADLSFVDGDFTPLSYTKGSSWSLANINGELLFGHHDGAICPAFRQPDTPKFRQGHFTSSSLFTMYYHPNWYWPVMSPDWMYWNGKIISLFQEETFPDLMNIHSLWRLIIIIRSGLVTHTGEFIKLSCSPGMRQHLVCIQKIKACLLQ